MIKILKLTKDNRGLAYSCLQEKGMWGNEEHQESLSFTYKEFETDFSAYAATYNGESAGHAIIINSKPPFSPVQSENSIFVHCLYVVNKFRNKGIGRQLMNLIEKDALDMGKDMIFVQSISNEWMKKDFFIKREYKAIEDDGINFILMKKLNKISKFSFVKHEDHSIKAERDSIVINYNPLCPVMISHYRRFVQKLREEIPNIKITENYLICSDDVCKNGEFGIYLNNTPLLINQRRISETIEIIISLRNST